MLMQAEGRQRGDVCRKCIQPSAIEQGGGVVIQQVGHVIPGLRFKQVIYGGLWIFLLNEIIGGGAIPLQALIGSGLLAQKIMKDVVGTL